MLYTDHFPPENHPNRPNLNLDQFLSRCMDKENVKKFWFALDQITKGHAVQIVVVSKNPSIYAGQRGLLYLLESALYDFFDEDEEDYDMTVPYSMKFHRQTHIAPNSHRATPRSDLHSKVILEQHLELTPQTMMNTRHFETNVYTNWVDWMNFFLVCRDQY
jgi:hypothetical protein